LIGETVQVRLFAEHLELWYGQKRIDTMPRLRGESKHAINYRHMIDWLERKPGAFENYRYREALFPTSHFRLAYDELKERHGLQKAAKEYLGILQCAAKESETAVVAALASLFGRQPVTAKAVEQIVCSSQQPTSVEIAIARVDLTAYDGLLQEQGVDHAL
jgi:hypothetical protein